MRLAQAVVTAAGLGGIILLAVPGGQAFGQVTTADQFVRRTGSRLTLGGAPFRYSGPNIEWLGLEGYGPFSPSAPHLPSHFEIDDAFDTASEMGARVVRSQTMGDSVGCEDCIEPTEGHFNEAAFQSSDYALSVARKHGMKVIITLIGDCATCRGGGTGQYLSWKNRKEGLDFFTDPALIAAFEKHIDAVMNHQNSFTGVRYKDDPTIMAWENCNMCGVHPLLASSGSTAGAAIAKWVETIGQHIKQIDHRHLYLDTTGIFPKYPDVIDATSTDLVTYEYYPHWNAILGPVHMVEASTFSKDAALITGRGKAYILNEYGWDKTDWKTEQDLQNVLDELAGDNNISGDSFWALQAHLDNYGFQPMAADSRDPKYSEFGESGQWWSLYYPGITNMVMKAEDMAARAQQLRAHAYIMSGNPVPRHNVPPSPVITSVVESWLVAFRGSAGAVRYSVQQLDPHSSEWKTICNQCATDQDDPWINPNGPAFGAQYRVIAWNLDGISSVPSAPW